IPYSEGAASHSRCWVSTARTKQWLSKAALADQPVRRAMSSTSARAEATGEDGRPTAHGGIVDRRPGVTLGWRLTLWTTDAEPEEVGQVPSGDSSPASTGRPARRRAGSCPRILRR